MNPPSIVPTANTLFPVPSVKLDAKGNVAEDVPCRRCGYNLRTLSPIGLCPECGTAVGRSLQGDFLQFSDPKWVEKLASGMNWIVASIIVGVFSGFILLGIASAISAAGSPWIGRMALPFAQFGLGLVGLVGYWKVATPDPARLEPESSTSARKLVRATQLFNYIMAPIAQIMGNYLPIAGLCLQVLTGIIGLVGMFAIFTYARHLALRIPEEPLARNCRTVMWGLVVTIVAAIAGEITSELASSGPAPSGAPDFISCFASVGFLVFAIWSLILILRFRRAFDKATRTARATWAGPATPAIIPPAAPTPARPSPPSRPTPPSGASPPPAAGVRPSPPAAVRPPRPPAPPARSTPRPPRSDPPLDPQ